MKSKSLACLALLSSVLAVVAQTSSFTYQGSFSSNGVPVTGAFDFAFTLHATPNLPAQIGSTVVVAPLGVTNGLFTTTLDFGSGVFDGSARWLQIGVRPNGDPNPYQLLAPRQLLTATPYAIRAANFSGPLGATNLTGKISDTNLSPNVALLTNNVVFTRTVTASNFIGSGFGLTNLAATNLNGTLPDALLSTNVAMLNASNATFLRSISATNFYGYGGGLTNVPGRIFEVIPTGTNLQAFANFGYLATNNTTAVVVTLPATANIRVGETIRVSGSGAGGWIVAQNPGQSILIGNLLTTVGFNWTTSGSALSWKAVAASSDGNKLVAATSGGNGQIYTSTNYGATWTARAILGNISSVASSGDGTKLVATVNGGFIYTTIDSGASWVTRTASGARNWTGVASSLDGTRLAACSSQGIFVSADSGVNWPASPQTLASWSGIASSADGTNLVAVIQGGQIGVSTNAGGSWAARESNRGWACVASSSDGGVLVAGANSGNNVLYTSTDFGASWVPAGPGLNWTGVACSSDGSRMIAVANGGGVYVSMDTGVTWSQRGNLPAGSAYTGAAASSDGSTMAAVALSNFIYVASQSTTSVGVTGELVGTRLAAVELQHVGNGVFIPISFVGTIRAN